ncbi:MAG: sodium/proline symporter PutP [Firmicutes bacterium]|nr:sodium/proline symporter PutP [Bacillota bacterium]
MDFVVLTCFVVYLALLLGIGVYSYTRSTTFDDYILGGRGLGKWTTALSAQASDMSGWLLMGLPGALYVSGLCESWIAIGLGIGTYLNWRFIAYRLRIFSVSLDNALTMPEYLSNRFHDNKNILKTLTAIFITIFFLLYTASAIVAGAKLFSTIFDFSYLQALIVGWAIILVYTFIGGFLAVCWTDFIQGSLMFLALVIVPSTMLVMIGGPDEVGALLANEGSTYLKFSGSEEGINWISVLSNLAWGLGYFGMPHIVVRFMAIKDPKELKASRIIATTWVAVTLFAAIVIGLVGRAFVLKYGIDLAASEAETIFLVAIEYIFPSAVAGWLLAAVLSATMSTADSQLLVSASSIANDLVKGFKNDISEKALLWISRISVLAIALLALVIALDPNNSVMGLVSDGWAGLGGTFSAIMILSLFWRKTSLAGAVSGIVVGGLTVIIWLFFLKDTGIYALLPAFILSALSIIVVSLMTPDKEAERLYDEAHKNL